MIGEIASRLFAGVVLGTAAGVFIVGPLLAKFKPRLDTDAIRAVLYACAICGALVMLVVPVG
jgi:hypothetical protein